MYYLICDSRREFLIVTVKEGQGLCRCSYWSTSIVDAFSASEQVHSDCLSIKSFLEDFKIEITLVCQFESLGQLRNSYPELFI